MMDFIQRMRSRPIHVRRRVTMAASGGITGLVAIVWLVSGIAMGTFSLSTPQQSSAVADLGNTFSQAGSQTASAFAGVTPLGDTATTSPVGGLTIVQTKQTSSIAQVDTSKQTVIPF